MQDLVASALCREMNVMAEVRLLGYGVEDVLRHVLGIGCGEAHAHIGNGTRHLPQQLGEGTDVQFLSVLFLDDDSVFRSCAVG